MPVSAFEHNCNTRDSDKEGEKAMESRGTVIEGMHLTPELGGIGENLPKESVKQGLETSFILVYSIQFL